MSIKASIFTDLTARLMAMLRFDIQIDANGNPVLDEDDNEIPIAEPALPNLQWVDLDAGQFELIDSGVFLPLPAVLIAFQETEFTPTLQQEQTGKGIIRIGIGYENYAASYEGSVDQAEALKYLAFCETVYTALQGYSTPNFERMVRVREINDDNYSNVIVNYIEFSTLWHDGSANPITNLVPVEDIEPRVRYEKPLTGTPQTYENNFTV
jgi:hypothetical protein